MVQFFATHYGTIPPHIIPFIFEALSAVCGHDLFEASKHFENESVPFLKTIKGMILF
jgi:hypothetical protein